MQAVLETLDYLADVKSLRLTEGEQNLIVNFLAENPSAGEEIPGSGGARKLRFAGKGKGKSGGYRVITFFSGEDIPIFLLSIFAKNEKINLSKAEVNVLKSTLKELAAAYRKDTQNDKGR